MPTKLDELFHSDFAENTHLWNVDVFRRAHVYAGSPFERVVYRIRKGFSVLVYLPGNCMRAAAEVERKQITNVTWNVTRKEYGLAEGNQQTMADIWKSSTSLWDSVKNWLGGAAGSRPYAIFHNLDMLADGRGGIDMSNEAKTALFYLTECSRSGVVLGLSDLSAGELPESIRRAFGEEVWLDEIPLARFPYLIPRTLGEKLAINDTLPDGPAHLLASRLRWTDPIRAVRIMNSVITATSIEDALVRVATHTRTVEFSDPASLRSEPSTARDKPPGYESSTIELLKYCVIEPFKSWAAYVGDKPDLQLCRLPAGIILHGPPGTGKSRLARWIACQIGIPFRQVGAADLKRADWGLTERMVRDLFRSARRAAPCMIVLDDADDLLPDREALTGGLAGAERGVVNAFLQELEGFHGRLEGVLVVLTTNRFTKLDKAVLSRLNINYRIPYPLKPEQIREIVVEIGRSFGSVPDKWAPGILERLIEFFFKPLRPVTEDVENPDIRRRMNDGLFSPREIATAMRMLMAGGDIPSADDVTRMENYYKG